MLLNNSPIIELKETRLRSDKRLLWRFEEKNRICIPTHKSSTKAVSTVLSRVFHTDAQLMNINQKLQYRNGVPVKLKLINKHTACLHVSKNYRYLSKYFRHRIVNCLEQKNIGQTSICLKNNFLLFLSTRTITVTYPNCRSKLFERLILHPFKSGFLKTSVQSCHMNWLM